MNAVGQDNKSSGLLAALSTTARSPSIGLSHLTVEYLQLNSSFSFREGAKKCRQGSLEVCEWPLSHLSPGSTQMNCQGAANVLPE